MPYHTNHYHVTPRNPRHGNVRMCVQYVHTWWNPSSHKNPRGKKLREGTAENRLAVNEKPLPPRLLPAPATSDFPVKCPIPPSMFDSAALAAATSGPSKPLSSRENVPRNRSEKDREPVASHPDTAAEGTNGRAAAAALLVRGSLSPPCAAALARTTKSTAKGAVPVTFRRFTGRKSGREEGLNFEDEQITLR